jgi:DNA-binding SARP family transcriptional activator
MVVGVQRRDCGGLAGVPLELSFLGSSEVRLNGRAINLPTRKAFALLAFIACEPGLHSREKLAAMFWPDNVESGGRTALRKALGFLNTALEVDQDSFLKATRDALGFDHGPSVQSDVLDLETAAKFARTTDDADASELRTRLEQVVDGLRGEFMAGFTLPESTDFEDWLDLRRESLRLDADAVLERLSSLQANASQVQVALVTARKRVALDALNEAAHRTVIELHLQTGDRAAALEAYRTCQDILEKELGLSPAAETQALADQARNGQRAPQPEPNPSGTAIVLKASAKTITTNVPFVGREREWAMLEDAWNTGMIAYVSGEPGSGKSRLMQEFMRSQGEFVTLENRPGDAGVPYASLARHLRMMFKHQPVTLEVWASTELSRILPELGGEPSPIQSEQGKLRFLQAIAHAFQTMIQNRDAITALVYDDAQFTDTSSSEATRFVLEQLEPPDRERLRILYGYRKNELSPELDDRVKQSLVTGEGALIELEALDETALVSLLQSSSSSFEMNDLTGIAGTLRRFTGGNPLFMLETIKALGETRGTERWTQQSLEVLQSSGGLPRTLKVKQVIERRLERLSKPAKDLLRVAAVMGQEYTLERAAKVLEADQLVLAEASEELEVVGIVRANRFTHDLLFEASYEGVPKAAKPLLHSRVLDVFEDGSVPAAVLADHAMQAGRFVEEFRLRFDAGVSASQLQAFASSVEHVERAREIFFEASASNSISPFTAFEVHNVYHQLMRNLGILDLYPRELEVFHEGIEIGKVLKDEEFQISLIDMVTTHQKSRFLMKSEEANKWHNLALEKAYKIERDDLILFLNGDFISLNENDSPNKSDDLKNAQNALDRARKFVNSGDSVSKYIHGKDYPNPKSFLVRVLIDLAEIQDSKNLYSEAELHFREATEVNGTLEEKYNPPYLKKMFSYLKIKLGQFKEAEELAAQAIVLAKTYWHSRSQVWAWFPLMEIWLETGRYTDALEKANELLETSSIDAKADLTEFRGRVHLALGDLQSAKAEFTQIENWDGPNPWEGNQTSWSEARLCAIYGRQGLMTQAAERAVKAVSETRGSNNMSPYWDLEAESLVWSKNMDLAKSDFQARETYVTPIMMAFVWHLRSRAVLERAEGQIDAAFQTLQQALERSKVIGLPREIWEITSDIARLLERQGHTDLAHEAWSRAVAVRDSLVVNVPEDMRARYLEFTDGQIHATLFLGEQ